MLNIKISISNWDTSVDFEINDKFIEENIKTQKIEVEVDEKQLKKSLDKVIDESIISKDNIEVKSLWEILSENSWTNIELHKKSKLPLTDAPNIEWLMKPEVKKTKRKHKFMSKKEWNFALEELYNGRTSVKEISETYWPKRSTVSSMYWKWKNNWFKIK